MTVSRKSRISLMFYVNVKNKHGTEETLEMEQRVYHRQYIE